MTQRIRVGFLGLGTMGAPMAANVAKAGFPLIVWNRTASKTQPLVRLGAKAGKSPAHVAAEVDVVVTMVARPQDVEQVVLGPDGVVDGLKAGSIVIDMSTVAPATSRSLAGAVAAKQGEFLDCPVVGSTGPAADGTLVILAGGLAQTLERARPLLSAMGKTVIHAGNVGSGSALKLATNLVLGHLMAGFAEGALLARRAGVEPEALIRVIEASTFQSPWYRGKGTPMLRGDFTTHFALKHMRKDFDLMSSLAHETATALPVTDAVRALFAEAESAGLGEQDYSAVFARLSALAPPPGAGLAAPRAGQAGARP